MPKINYKFEIGEKVYVRPNKFLPDGGFGKIICRDGMQTSYEVKEFPTRFKPDPISRWFKEDELQLLTDTPIRGIFNKLKFLRKL